MTSCASGTSLEPAEKEHEHQGFLITVLSANNIHCASCVTCVNEVLQFLPSVRDVQVSIGTQEVRIRHASDGGASELASVLVDAGFEIYHATTYSEEGSIVVDLGTSFPPLCNTNIAPLPWLPSSRLSSMGADRRSGGSLRTRHIENCDACRTEELENEKWMYQSKDVNHTPQQDARSSPSDNETHVSQMEALTMKSEQEYPLYSVPRKASKLMHSQNPATDPSLDLSAQTTILEELDARISVSGMTCAACVNTVTNAIQELDCVKALNVSLLTNSATLTFHGPKSNIDRITEQIEDTGFEATVDEINLKPQPLQQSFQAQLSIAGMTSSSCVDSLHSQLKQLECITSVSISLMSAILTYSGPKSNIHGIIKAVQGIGLEAVVDQVRLLQDHRGTSQSYMADIGIGGMTCSSCVGIVTRGLQELPFVRKVMVDLLSNSGKVEFEGEENLDKIIHQVNNLGYDGTLSACRSLSAEEWGDRTRTVTIRVEGMFCHHCPEKILTSLNAISHPFVPVEIEKEPSLGDPILKVVYSPRSPSFTIRNIIGAINSADNAFKAIVFHPPSIEDRSRAIQMLERRRLLSRFFFVLIVAIPTFLFGVLFMTLLSPDGTVRKFMEQPMGSSAVPRIEWALFIMTTPVMFYGTDIFHVRAMKEIRALWRPGSKVPVLRRFYRFGSMNLLISAGTLVAYASSLAIIIIGAMATPSLANRVSTYFDSVVFLTLFILAGRSLEAYSKAKAGDAVTALGKLRSGEALLLTETDGQPRPDGGVSQGGGKTDRISTDLLEAGDVVSIPHGASPPADGIIMGRALYRFDESSLTGESRPVTKSYADKVYIGSVNVGQPVSIKVSELGGASLLDKIIDVVREGLNKRAPLERVADVLTAYFVPVITLIAISIFTLWLALGQSGILPVDYLDNPLGGWAYWSLQFAIAVFVVACPCGLALAAPTALFVGGGLAAKKGILVKGGGEAFQEASRLNAIVFDKTGTLTEGCGLKVSSHEVLVKDSEQEQVAWALAYELEQCSNHPIARAISDFCRDKSSVHITSSDTSEIIGQGMKGTFTLSIKSPNCDQKEVQVKYEAALGNERLLHSLVAPGWDAYFLENLLSKHQSSGHSTAILSLRKLTGDNHEISYFSPIMMFAVSDPVRQESVEVISRLQKTHMDVFMFTGDNKTTAHAVAATLGIPYSNVIANALPHQKASFVKKIQEGAMFDSYEINGRSKGEKTKRPIVAFVGDGTNDSPALAAADVSIAMASGSDIAINSASFILLNSDLNTILELITVSRRVFNRVKMNFCWAAVYNICLVPIAAGVLYPIVTGHADQMVGGDMRATPTHWRLSPVWAALAMALSSVSVVLSSLALRLEGKHIRRLFSFSPSDDSTGQ